MAKKKTIDRLTLKQVQARLSKLKGERGTWENHWQEVTDYILPRKNTILNKKSDGQKRTWQLLDNTGVQSNELLAGMLHGLLTNPDMPWFELTTSNLELDSRADVRTWLQDTARDMHNILNNSNFQTEVHELYTDLVSIGTANMLLEEDPKFLIRFSTKFIADYWIEENYQGLVDKLYREWKCNASELIAEFGEDKMPKKVLDSYKTGKDEKFCIIHAVYPKYLVDAESNDKMQYVSQYFLPECNHEVDYGEFAEFPYVVPRWSKAAGETYGRSPGMTALPELKVLNKMNETLLIGAQKVVDPPLQLPDDGFIMPIITRPGGLNYYRPGTNDMIKPIFNDTRLDFGYQAMEDRRKRVKDAYYVDQLKLQQGGPMMTATEVLQRTEESMRLLGPMLGRMQSEFLRPLIGRLYRLMSDANLIKEAPPELQTARLDVKYSSLVARSQRITEAQSIMRLVSASAPFMQIDPSVADNFNGDAAVKILAQTYGTPQQILNPDKFVQQKRAARQQAQAAAAQAQDDQAQVDNSLTVVRAMKEAQGMNG